MKIRCISIVLVVILQISQLSSVYLTQESLKKLKHYISQGHLARIRRQALNNPQIWFGPPGTNIALQVPIPTNIGFFPGGGGQPDQCDRDEIQMEDGTCQMPLTQGNCEVNQEVILDPQTNRGFCAQRLCPPDRVFLPLTQLCHDPLEENICPPGRQLFYSAYGTPVCSCPDGTIEGDDDLDDDVCEEVLGKSLQCMPGEVFWFRNFESPPQCLPDPCNGQNLNRNPNELPFVPHEVDGICKQIGSSFGVCPYNQYLALSYESLKGKCVTLEEAGFVTFNQDTLGMLRTFFSGKFTNRNAGAAIDAPNTGNNANNIQSNVIGGNDNFISQGNLIQNQNVQQNQIDSMLSLSPPTIESNAINGNTIIQTVGGTTQNTQQISSNNIVVGQPSGVQTSPGHFPQTPTQNQNTISSNSGIQGQNQIFQNQNAFSQNQNQFSQNNAQNQGINFGGASNIFVGSPSAGSQSQGHPGFTTFDTNQHNQINNGGSNAGLSPGYIATDGQGQVTTGNTQASQNTQFAQGHQNSFSSQQPGNQQIIHSTSQIVGSTSSHGQQQLISQNQGTSQQSHQSSTHQQFDQGQFQSQGQIQSQGNVQNYQPATTAGNVQIQGNQQVFQHQSGQNQNLGGQNFGSFGQPISIEVISGPHGLHGFQQPISIEVVGQGGQASAGFNSPELFGSVNGSLFQSIEVFGSDYGMRVGRSMGLQTDPWQLDLAAHYAISHDGQVQHHYPRRIRRSTRSAKLSQKLSSQKVLSRKKRQSLPYASPSNVFETRLLGCKPGAVRDINAKCRDTILPARVPKRRGTRAAPPVPPTPSCGANEAFNIRRMCVPSNTAQDSIVAFNLG